MGLSGRWGDRGQQMGAAALPLALNHVESKRACAIPARVLARKDPSTRRNRSQDDNGLGNIKVCFPEIVTEIGGARAAAAAPAREQDAQHLASFDLAALAARQHAWCQSCALKTAPTCSTCLAPTAQACPRAAAKDAVAAGVVDARCHAQEHTLVPGVACARLPA